MTILKSPMNREYFRYHGNEVLRLEFCQPQGETPAAKHIRHLTETLAVFVRETLVGQAQNRFEEAATAGHGYLFPRYLCRISCKEVPEKAGIAIRVRFSVLAGGEILHAAELETFWDATGEKQIQKEKNNFFKIFFGKKEKNDKLRRKNASDK